MIGPSYSAMHWGYIDVGKISSRPHCNLTLEIMVRFGGFIPILGRKIQVSEIL
jgi:hypothetical protein